MFDDLLFYRWQLRTDFCTSILRLTSIYPSYGMYSDKGKA